jgi:flagellar biosynthesis protein FlhB
MADEYGEKTEQATPRRREKAREKGDVPKSRELTSLLPVWTIFLYLMFGSAVFTAVLGYFRSSLLRGTSSPLDESTLMEIFRADSVQIGIILMPLFFLMLFGVLVVHFLQTGFLISTYPLEPDISKINPLNGLKKMFSVTTVYETVKGLLKVLVLGLILYLMLKNEMLSLPVMVDMSMPSIVDFSFDEIKKLVMISAIVLTLFAAIDYAYQRWNYSRGLRMTKEEVKEEFKDVEGSPMIKARIRSIQRELARRRMMQEVPKADVVITNPIHFAVALKYDLEQMGAPRVVAKGANLVADRIREIARGNSVPVIENRPLARALFKLEINQEIPEIFYKAVAAILAQVYKMKGKVQVREDGTGN